MMLNADPPPPLQKTTNARERLLASARAGNQEDRGRLLLGYEAYLLLLLRARLGNDLRSKVDPDDIVQATFLDAHRQFDQFRGNTEPEITAWLRAILAGQLARVARQYLGAAARDVRLERQIEIDLKDSSRVLDLGLAANDSTPSQHASRRERAVLLADALERLPDNYREVIVLRHVEGLAFAKVAERMERTEDSVQKIWVRALAKLRQSLEKRLEEDD